MKKAYSQESDMKKLLTKVVRFSMPFGGLCLLCAYSSATRRAL